VSKRPLDRLAELVVVKGASVQPGQIVFVTTAIEKIELARAIADAAYKHGAKFVDVWYVDFHVKRARIEYAREETLDFVPSWYGDRMLALGKQRCARISLSGPATPGLLDDLDPARSGRDQLPIVKELMTVINERTTNWTAVPAPTPAWAELIFPELEPAEAYARLWREVEYVCRLDSPDPIAAWQERMDFLAGVASRLTERRFDALHFEGPGTNLTVGLLPSSSWMSATFTTADGIEHMPNLPTEEVFTSPDPQRAEGFVRATKPLVLTDGTIITGLTMRFEGGRAVAIEAESGADALRARSARDEGATRLGEVALVDGEGRIGALGTVFYDTLLDENAASHIALGDGFDFVLDQDDHPRRNRSGVHIDFMIGGDDVAVTGLTNEGERVPILRSGAWQI
jgi:aminopeptidase